MESLKDSLTCPICYELFEDARTLPCQHVVCKSCIELWVKKKGKLSCPTCRTESELPAGGVSGLPSNFTLNGIVETFKMNGSEVKESPDPEKSTINKSGKDYQHICGAVICCPIQICNSAGKIIKGIDSNRIAATLSFKDMEKELTPNQNEGELKLSFVPERCGVHKVEVLIDGQKLKNSPLDIVVHPQGTLLSFVKGDIKQPLDVLSCDESFLIADTSYGGYAHVNQHGHLMSSASSIRKDDGEEMSPFGIARASNGTMYITDTSNNSVRIFQKGEYSERFGEQHLSDPTGIEVGKDGLIYVANQGSGGITIFNNTLEYVRTINFENSGKKLKSKPSIAGLALNNAQNKLIAADQANCCLLIINILEAKVERFVNTFSSKNNKATPNGVTVDDDDNIFTTVTSHWSNKSSGGGSGAGNDEGTNMRGTVLMYNNEGFFLGRFGTGELINPGGVCVCKKAEYLSVVVVEITGTGYGTRAPGLKVFRVANSSIEAS